MRINTGVNYNERFWTKLGSHKYRFLDYIANPFFSGVAYQHQRVYSSDKGKTWTKEDKIQLFGAYFFLSEDIVNNGMTLYTIKDLISDFGGLYYTFVIAFFYSIGSNINHNLNMSKLIRGVLYKEKGNMDNKKRSTTEEKNALIQNLQPIYFTPKQKLKIMLKQYLPSVCTTNPFNKHKEKKDYEQIFEKG